MKKTDAKNVTYQYARKNAKTVLYTNQVSKQIADLTLYGAKGPNQEPPSIDNLPPDGRRGQKPGENWTSQRGLNRWRKY